MFTLVKNADIYAPAHLGRGDVLLCGEKVVAVGGSLDAGGLGARVIDAGGMILTPGLIDQHVHIIGGGGQTGFFSLAPEVKVADLVKCGTTTVVGMLGTDGFVKQLPALYAKAKSLEQNGLSAWMLTGFYGLPTPTITGSVAEDLIYVDKVIGCKIAIADDRSSFPTEQDLLRIIQQVRLGGFTSAKGGVMHVHLGPLEDGMSLLLDIARKYPSLTGYISPTHVGRTKALFDQAREFAKMGGMIDISTGGTKYAQPWETVMDGLADGVSIDRMTLSSDGNAGVRRVDPATGEESYRLAPLHLNLEQVVKLVTEGGVNPAEAFKLLTVNPARTMKLRGKGEVAPGMDADLCLFDSSWQLHTVVARGCVMMSEGEVVRKGNFE